MEQTRSRLGALHMSLQVKRGREAGARVRSRSGAHRFRTAPGRRRRRARNPAFDPAFRGRGPARAGEGKLRAGPAARFPCRDARIWSGLRSRWPLRLRSRRPDPPSPQAAPPHYCGPSGRGPGPVPSAPHCRIRVGRGTAADRRSESPRRIRAPSRSESPPPADPAGPASRHAAPSGRAGGQQAVRVTTPAPGCELETARARLGSESIRVPAPCRRRRPATASDRSGEWRVPRLRTRRTASSLCGVRC